MKPSAILTADKHLREDIPVCRTDDYVQAQWDKIQFENQLAEKYGCPILDAGDVFNKWKPSPWLIREAVERLGGNRITIPGNHDLPNHSLESYEKSGLSVLESVDIYTVLKNNCLKEKEFNVCGISYGQAGNWNRADDNKSILLLHQMVWQGKKLPYPGAENEGNEVTELLKKYPEFDLIVTGHNHQTFVQEYKGRLLVNPGSMMRSTTDQMDFKPSLFLWYADTNKVEQVFYPIKQGVITREHIEKREEQDARLQAFVQGLKQDAEIGLGFERNLEQFMNKNNISAAVKEKVWQFATR